MFRKIVSNLPFSPALVGQLGFYAKRLRKEETTRRAGLIVTALALVFQSLAVFSPPEAANASSPADFISGGVANKQAFLNHYDNNTNRIKGLFSNLGITRAEVAAAKEGTIAKSGVAGKYNWSRTSLYSYAQGQRSYTFDKTTFYYRPLSLTANNPPYKVLVGHSAQFGWFAIKMDCGNLITKTPPKAPKPQVICEDLTVKRLSATRFRLTAEASTKNGAKIKGYTFAIAHEGKTIQRNKDTSAKSTSIEYANDDSGTYNASVTVRSSEGPEVSNDCRGSFSVNTDASCENLAVQKLNQTSFKITSKAQATKGVAIKKYVYTIKNDAGRTIATKSFDSAAKTHSFTYTQKTPGTYKVSLIVKTSIGDQKGNDCKASFTVAIPQVPTVLCKNIDATLTNRTVVSLAGSAQATNGATIKKYTFIVKDSSGNEVKRVEVISSKSSVTADSFELNTVGTYRVELIVGSSLGDIRSNDNCVDSFTINKQEVCAVNPALPEDSPECQPCPGNPSLWIKDEQCAAEILNTKSAINKSLDGVSATKSVARAGDKIEYSLTVENRGLIAKKTTIRESLNDVLQYATLIDGGNGTFKKSEKTLTWPEVTIEPGKKQTRTFVVQVMKEIPTTNTGVSDESSYDCVMTNTFGNAVDISVKCPQEKVLIERTVSELPKTGPGENILFAGMLLAIVTYFYARSRQLGTEVKLIRRNVNAGTI